MSARKADADGCASAGDTEDGAECVKRDAGTRRCESSGSISPPLRMGMYTGPGSTSGSDDSAFNETNSDNDDEFRGSDEPRRFSGERGLAHDNRDSGLSSAAPSSEDPSHQSADASASRREGRKRTRLSPTSVLSEALGIRSADTSPIPEFECALCLQLLCEPITTPCGHTFCRNCLVCALERSKKQCPECRAPCHIAAESHPISVLVSSLLQRLYPQLYAARSAEAESERATWQAKVPLFMMNAVLVPGQPIGLHLFEPRYRLMIRRVVEGNRTFGYLATNPEQGAVGVLVQVSECEFFADGRALISGTARQRFRIQDAWVEPGTQGLHYARVECVDDVDVPTEAEWPVAHRRPLSWAAPDGFDDLWSETKRLVHAYLRMLSFEESRTEWGDPPENPTAFSFWVTAVLPVVNRTKLDLLSCTSTVARLESLVRELRRLVNHSQTSAEPATSGSAAEPREVSSESAHSEADDGRGRRASDQSDAQ